MDSENEFAAAIRQEATNCLDDSMTQIRHCLSQLTDEQVRWRPAPGMNSVEILLQHLAGNLRQWAIAGLSSADDTRQRKLEFESTDRSKEELWQQLENIVNEAKEVIDGIDANGLLESRLVQGSWDVTGVGALFRTIPHFQGHTQEIVCLARLQLGDRYEYRWTPKTPAEGA